MQVLVFDRPTNTAGTFIDNLSAIVSSPVISTKVPGLSFKFSCSISGPLAYMMRIFNEYLGMRIVVFDDNGDVVWDGMIWSLDLSIGNNSLGPVSMDYIGNYVAVEYSDLLNSNNYAITSYVSSADSQAKYGIIEKVESMGGLTSTAASNLVNRYSTNHAEAFVGGNPSIPIQGDDATVTIEALGWWATTNFRKFQSALTTTLTVQNRLIEIVNRSVVPAAPGTSYYLQFFDTDTSLITGPNLTIARATLHVETAGSYMSRVVNLGDTSFNTWFIGAELGSFAGMIPLGSPRIKTWQRPTTPDFYVDSASGRIYGAGGQPVSPYAVRAGSMVFITDISPSFNAVHVPLDNRNGFVIVETSYNPAQGILSVTPEGSDTDIALILSRF